MRKFPLLLIIAILIFSSSFLLTKSDVDPPFIDCDRVCDSVLESCVLSSGCPPTEIIWQEIANCVCKIGCEDEEIQQLIYDCVEDQQAPPSEPCFYDIN